MNDAKPLAHGGDWAGFEIEYGKRPLDFSMNVNPLGMCPGVEAAVAKSLKDADRYPDPLCRQLKETVAEAEGIPRDWLFFGNGASEVIYRLGAGLTDAPGELLITAPTFGEYETSFRQNGWDVGRYYLEEGKDFRIQEDILESLPREGGALILCEPNNPTGVTTDRTLLMKILEECESRDTYMIVDECFNGFLDEPEEHTLKGELEDHPHLIILKAFTKLYGIAGLRLGYCLCSDPKVIEALERSGPLWNVSAPAQAAGIAAVAEKEYVEEARIIVTRQRQWLKEALEDMGIRPVWGRANYLLFHAGKDLDRKMRERGILIRNCDNYPGLGEGWYRVAVRKSEENRLMVEAMRACLGG